MVSIDSLPNELISMIIEMVVITQNNCRSFPYVATPQSSITAIASCALVSRRWDDIVRSHMRLWASAINVDSDSLSKVQILAGRAGGVPWAITSSNRETTFQRFDTDAWKYVFAHIDSWESLSLQTCVFSNKERLWCALTQSAPKLEVFKLHNMYYDRMDGMDDVDPEYFVLPTDLFGGHALRLRKVSLINVYFPPCFDFSDWKQLTVLRVEHDLDGTEDSAFYAHQWLEILSGTPLLEALYLGWDLSDSEESLPSFMLKSEHHSGADVQLNQLRRLILSAPNEGADIALHISARLRIPNACNASITFMPQEGTRFELLEVAVNCRMQEWYSLGIPFRHEIWNEPQQMHFGIAILAPSIGGTLSVCCIGISADVPTMGAVPFVRAACPFVRMLNLSNT